MATTVFFDYLLKETGVLATDDHHTIKGKEFWIKRIRNYFDRRYHVYYIDIGKEQECIDLENNAHFSSVNHYKKIWGVGRQFRSRRIMVSRQKIRCKKQPIM